MKAKIYLLLLLNIFVFGITFSQNKTLNVRSDTLPFNYSYWKKEADKKHLNPFEKESYLAGQKRLHTDSIKKKYFPTLYTPILQPFSKGYSGNTTNIINGPCTNIDFELGNLSGWTRSCGFNPNATNPIYLPPCCPNPNGQQITVTTGLDPYGGFPKVFPGGGGTSVQLGNNVTGAQADRLEQTFSVTPANANFTYRYAVVLENPAGHAATEQPIFEIEMLTVPGGTPIPCTYYQVVSSATAVGFFASPGNPGVLYKPWTSVAIDLTPVIGQNVMIRFTVMDCSLGGHFGYAYIDATCTDFALSTSDTTCANVAKQMCAPVGFANYLWNGPGILNNTSQCISPILPGTYSCTTILVPGCPGPTFVHTLTTLPVPQISFTAVGASTCSAQFSISNTGTISSGLVVTYNYLFGDGGFLTSTVLPAPFIHNYASSGSYPVMFRAISNLGCRDSLTKIVVVNPTPSLSFSPPSNCINTAVQFTNTSTIGAGGAPVSYTWNLGNGVNSTLVNPNTTYTTNGTYNITLTAQSAQGCTASLSQTLGIFPPPILSFNAAPLCDVNGTSFSPATSTAIASGSLVAFNWNFGDPPSGAANTSNQQTPLHIYSLPGTYSVSFSATSNHNCVASTSNTFLISPSPVVSFNTNSVNPCAPNYSFVNTSTIAAGPITYSWNFGGTNTTSAISPTFAFAVGNHTVMLIGTSNLGCGDTAVTTLTVFPLPLVSFNVPSPCENAIFTSSPTALSGSVATYAWDFGDGGTSGLQNPTHAYPVNGNFTISLVVTSNVGCISNYSTTTLVYPNPVADFTFTPVNACSPIYPFVNNSSVTATGGNSVVAYNWDFAATASSTAQSPTNTFAGPGNYSVSLIAITNHNCSDTITKNMRVYPFPSVNFTVAPNCLNLGSNFIGASSISAVPTGSVNSINSYTWNFGDATTSNIAAPPTHTFLTDGIYTASFSVTSDQGCMSSISHTLTVYPIPIVNYTTTSNMCLGFTTAFSSTNSINSGAISSFSWSFGDGGSSINPNPSHTYSTSNSFPVTFSATSNFGCLSTLTKTVTVYPLPSVSFTANGGCLNTTSNFNESSTISLGSIVSYTYNFGDNTPNDPLKNFQNPTHTYTLNGFGLFTPTLTVTSNQGCVNSNTSSVLIQPLPIVSFVPPGACVGSAIQFTNTSSIPIGVISSYVWNFSDGSPTVSIAAPQHTFSIPAIYIVTLTATSNQGCVNIFTNNLSIYPYPSVSITPINSSCVNQTVSIYPNVTITGINNPISGYTLSFGDGSPALTSTTALTYTVPHVYSGYNTYTVTLSAISHGCAKDTTTLLKIYPVPFSNFVSSKFCFHDSTKFVNTSTIAATYTIQAHNWNFGDGASPQSTLQNTSHLFSGPGTFTVNLTEFTFPEPGVTCSLSTIKILTINPLPLTSFVSNSVCFGSTTQFTNTTPTTGITGWSWFTNNNQLFSIATNPAYTYSTSGKFLTSLAAINNFGCRDTVRDTVRVYSNPTASFVTTNVCLGNQSIFNGQTPTLSLVDGSISTYTWNTNSNPAFSFIQNAVFTYTAAGTYSVEYNVGSTKGCIGKYTKSVVVYPTPSINFTATEVCQNNPTKFINQSFISNGSIASFLWSFNDPAAGTNSTSVLINPTHSFPGSGTFATTLEAVSDNGCPSTPKVINVLVHSNPTANFKHTVICVGDKLSFANLSSSSDGTITSNQWDFNGDNTVDQDGPVPAYTYTIGGNFNARLKVVTQYGCWDTVLQKIFVNPKAIPNIGSNNRAGCPSLCINFKNLSTIANGTFTTLWDFGDGSPANTFTSATKCYDSGIYDISLTMLSDSGCTTRFVYPGYVSVYPLPVAGFKVEPEEIDEDEPIITVSNQSSADASTIKYYITDGFSSGSPNFTHIIKNLKQTKPMVVQIVGNKYGCSDTIFQVLNIRPDYVIYFPDVFTPNGDGTNDDFRPKGVGILKFNMQIFDRWDNQVFHTNDMSVTWDGRSKSDSESIKEDVYTWKAQVTDIFNKNHFLVGRVAIIR